MADDNYGNDGAMLMLAASLDGKAIKSATVVERGDHAFLWMALDDGREIEVGVYGIRANLEQVTDVEWEDGTRGYDPANLEVKRFGLNYDFIVANHYTWIDNLITGSGKNLADPAHPNHNLSYVRSYLRTIGARKCEANAIVTTPQAARELCRRAIESFLTAGARARFAAKRENVKKEYRKLLTKTGLIQVIGKVLRNGDES